MGSDFWFDFIFEFFVLRRISSASVDAELFDGADSTHTPIGG